MKYTVNLNQGFVSQCQPLLEYGRHVARLRRRRRRRRRRRAYAPTSNTASHDQLMGFLFFRMISMGLRLAALRAAGAPLISK